MQITVPKENDVEELARVGGELFYALYQQCDPENIATGEKYVAEHFTAEKIRADFASDLIQYYVAKDNERIVGYIKLRLDDNPPRELVCDTSVEAARVYVNETHKGKGIGRKLIETAMEFVAQSGNRGLWLQVWDKNLPALAFYERMGFENRGFIPWVFAEVNDQDILLYLQV